MSEDAPIRYDVPATLEKWQSLAEKQVWDAGERLPAPRWVEKGWRRQFDDPIVLPNGRKLVTLEDAGSYITKLPKAEHDAPES